MPDQGSQRRIATYATDARQNRRDRQRDRAARSDYADGRAGVGAHAVCRLIDQRDCAQDNATAGTTEDGTGDRTGDDASPERDKASPR
jgi:hypothetical protein